MVTCTNCKVTRVLNRTGIVAGERNGRTEPGSNELKGPDCFILLNLSPSLYHTLLVCERGVKELKSKYQETSLNKDMVKIEEYDDGMVPSGSEHALVPYVQKVNLSDENLASGVVIAKEEGGPSSSSSNLRLHFIGMGFSSELVEKVLQENGEDDANIILETLFKYSALEEQVNDSSGSLGGLFSSDSDGEIQVPSGSHTSKCYLNSKHVSPDRCNVKMETDFSTTKGKRSYTSLTSDAGFYYEDKNNEGENRPDKSSKSILIEKKGPANQVNHSGPRTCSSSFVNNEVRRSRALPDMPLFIYGSVIELSEKTWQLYSQFLFNSKHELVNSQVFSALKRQEGYLHNLPTETRHHIQSRMPMSIEGVVPITRNWWPPWDPRRQLNSKILVDMTGISQVCENLERRVKDSHGQLSRHDQNLILNQCGELNLIWVCKNKLAALEPDQLEKVLGYPINHTHLTDFDLSHRLRTMEHCFQTDTIGYILSPLKDLYPDGLRILSLYTGIGGAEVALSRLGLHLKCVVSVETSEVNRKIFKRWWESTGQSGELRQIDDVTKLTLQLLKQFVSEFRGFDLVVGAHLQETLVECTDLFFEFYRVVTQLNVIMRDIH